MAAPSQKPRRKRSKSSKSRPAATSSISQPAIKDAWPSTVLSAFSPDARLFAFLSLAIDKHRLRVLDTTTNQSIAECIFDRARVTCLEWIAYDATSLGVSMNGENLPSKKRKVAVSLDETSRSSNSIGETQMEWSIGLGLSDGSVQIYSVREGRVVKTLKGADNNSAVLAIADNSLHGNDGPLVWTSSTDGTLRLWDTRNAVVIVSSQEKDSQYSALVIRPQLHSNATHVLAAHSTIRLLSFPTDETSSEDSESDELEEVCSFSGHASPVKSLIWEHSSSPSRRFLSCAEGDRFIYLWRVPRPSLERGDLVASYALDADVVQLDISPLPGRQILLAVSSSGKVVLFPIPEDLDVPSNITESATKPQVATLLPGSVINLPKTLPPDIRIVAATFLKNDPSKIRVAIASGGVKVIFENLEYLDRSGQFIPELILKSSSSAFAVDKSTGGAIIVNKRYSEPSGLPVATGAETPHDPSLDAIVDRDVDGLLNADLAELSLGQRLTVRSDAAAEGQTVMERNPFGSNAEGAHVEGRKERSRPQMMHVPAHSLTRTLIQALHAGDTSLLEACLAHSDETVVHKTVARLPAQLAIPLLTACVERLGRGARGNNIKGRGGGASAQRGLSLMKWVRAVLVIHTGHLMTMPDLIARLSLLHSTLTTRIILQERLLSLSGRLDLVLAQAELRSSNAPAPLSSKKKPQKAGKAMKEPLKYVEGESSDEGVEDEEMQVEDEEDDEGSIEDVELDEDSDQVSDEEESNSGGEESDDANLMDGSVEDEAEEEYDEESWEEDSD
ncbi:UTP5 [Sanghuangporus vaninii]